VVARRTPPPIAPKCCSSNVSLLAPPRTCTATAALAGRRTVTLLAPPPIRTVTLPDGGGSHASTSLAPPRTSNDARRSPRRSALNFETPPRISICQGMVVLSVISAACRPQSRAYLAHSASEWRRYCTLTKPSRTATRGSGPSKCARKSSGIAARVPIVTSEAPRTNSSRPCVVAPSGAAKSLCDSSLDELLTTGSPLSSYPG
jgi:hypothetical protein